MLASSRKPRGGKKLRRWRQQRRFLRRRRSWLKRSASRRPSGPTRRSVAERPVARSAPEAIRAGAMSPAPKSGFGFLSALVALGSVMSRPFRRGGRRGV